MKQRVRNAISIICKFILILVSLIFSLSLNAQDIDNGEGLSCAQYEFLNDVFGKYSDKQEKVYYQPKNQEIWINEFLTFKSDIGIGTCIFNEGSLEEAIEGLNKKEFLTKSYERKKLPKRLKPLKEPSERSGLHISEPIIIDSYCFLFIWEKSYRAVEIYHFEVDDHWKFKCFALLSGEL
ncbi:hypothetical protein [Algoriphagus sp.]|uniref:hypothetical protein n=1 Tax=Algoriphagus sp. TaxID=1872435 RepID=UPI002607439C|nr:hypothetical protein [Algoriphagus sp.]